MLENKLLEQIRAENREEWKPNILALDISGNHESEKEGSGTTGIASRRINKFALGEIKASDYDSTEMYWSSIVEMATDPCWHHVVIEGYKLYNHTGMAARTQTNSTLMTSQLLGALRLGLWTSDIPYTIQYASDVKTRWADDILIRKKYLQEGNKFKGKRTNDHMRDALRHLAHFIEYKESKLKR